MNSPIDAHAAMVAFFAWVRRHRRGAELTVPPRRFMAGGAEPEVA